MLLFEVSTTISPLQLKTDNPGGSWLEHKKNTTLESGKDEYGFFVNVGTVTGYYNREAFLPVSILKNIKGRLGEQGKVRQHDLEWIRNNFKQTGKLPQSDAYDHKEYAPLIIVDQEGTAMVYEGNHRIMAASLENIDVLPVTIRYFNGGEEVNGLLQPDKVKSLDSGILSKGYGFGKYRL